jgi:ABC-type transporter lipoprotein component MlaA
MRRTAMFNENETLKELETYMSEIVSDLDKFVIVPLQNFYRGIVDEKIAAGILPLGDTSDMMTFAALEYIREVEKLLKKEIKAS